MVVTVIMMMTVAMVMLDIATVMMVINGPVDSDDHGELGDIGYWLP